MVICSNLKMNCINQNQKESCYLCHKTLDIWIKTSIYLDGTEKPIILCYNCAKEIAKDVDKNSTEPETRELLLDVKEYQEKPVSLCIFIVFVLLLFGLFFDLFLTQIDTLLFFVC